MNAGERAAASAARAARWRIGDTFEGALVEGIARISHWHVVLYLPTELVELDPDDHIVSRRPRSAEPSQVSKEPTQAPLAAPGGPAQQELF